MNDTIQEIQQVLNTLRPAIVQDGGDIEFVALKDNIVYVRLHGACVQCPISIITLKLGIEEQLKVQIPTIKEVVSVE